MRKAIVVKKGFLVGVAVLLILLPVFFGCENGGGENPTPTEYWSITWVFGDDKVIDKGTASYPSEILKGEVLAKPTPDPTSEDWVFEGWFTGEEADVKYNFTAAVTGDLTLTAVWLPIPEGISGFPETLTMGVPFDLRKGIRVKLPEAPDKTFDDIIWASNTSGVAFASTQIVIEDDLFIPVTFFTSKVAVYAIVKDGEGEGFDYTETFDTNIVFPLNPFIGSWSGSDGKTWTFKTDGTYGIDTVANTGSFVVWSGKPGRKFLVTVSGDPDTITIEDVGDPENGLYTAYCFEQTGNTIKITPIEFDYHAVSNKQDPNSFDEIGTPITLTRQSGAPAAFDLSQNASSSVMIASWTGSFTNALFNPSSDTITGNARNVTYSKDGLVQFHGPNYPASNYEGAWLKRGEIFVTVGNDGRRWDPPALAKWDVVTATAMDNKEVVRIEEYRPDGAGEPYSRQTNTSLCWRLVKWVAP